QGSPGAGVPQDEEEPVAVFYRRRRQRGRSSSGRRAAGQGLKQHALGVVTGRFAFCGALRDRMGSRVNGARQETRARGARDTKGGWRTVRHVRVLVAAAAAGAMLAVAGCGGTASENSGGVDRNKGDKGSLTIADAGFTESEIVANMFADVLSKAGYK